MEINIKNSVFIPPFCPNDECRYHFLGDNFYKKNGVVKTRKPPYVNQRYICNCCGVQFSRNTFSFDFRKKLVDLSETILKLSMQGMTNCSISRHLNVRERVVRNRIAHMARQGQLYEKEVEAALDIVEPIAYDGFETFSGSQFSPCYINTSVGLNSLFTFSVNFSPLNRKGAMTEWQKIKNEELRKTFGLYPKDSIRVQSIESFSQLRSKARFLPIIIHTDEHKTYQNILKYQFRDSFIHLQTHSKKPRTTSNPLFPVNHLHLNFRHFLSSHRRETIAFNKNEAGLMDKILLMKVYKNYMRPKTLRKRRRQIPSPAMDLSLTKKILKFSDIFSRRRFFTHYVFSENEELVFRRLYKFSRMKIVPYYGK